MKVKYKIAVIVYTIIIGIIATFITLPFVRENRKNQFAIGAIALLSSLVVAGVGNRIISNIARRDPSTESSK